MSPQTFHSADSTTLLASELREQTLVHSLEAPPDGVVRHFLVATATLTLVLATMGKLGTSALIIGPLMAIVLVVDRALLMGAKADDDTRT